MVKCKWCDKLLSYDETNQRGMTFYGNNYQESL